MKWIITGEDKGNSDVFGDKVVETEVPEYAKWWINHLIDSGERFTVTVI